MELKDRLMLNNRQRRKYFSRWMIDKFIDRNKRRFKMGGKRHIDASK